MTTRQVAILVAGGFGVAALVAALALTPWRTTAAEGLGAEVRQSIAQDFTAPERIRGEARAAAIRPPVLASLVVSTLLALLLGFTGLGSRLLAALPAAGGWLGRLALGVLLLSLLGRLVTLGLDARAEQVQRSFGLSTRSWSAWLLDQGKAWAISTGILLIVVVALFGLIRVLPRLWPLVAAVGVAGVVFAASFLFPLVVEPLFARFTPMPPGELRTSLMTLAERDGVPVREVLVADASRRTTALNAYVSGLGPTRRLVVYDNLVNAAPEAEVQLVVAHELGHAKDNDVLHGTLIAALGAGAAAGLLGLVLTSGAVLRRVGSPAAGDPRSLALVLAVLAVLLVVTGPIQAMLSRRVEVRADEHALELTRDPATFAAMQRRLAVTNAADVDPPRPLHLFFATHPTTAERIAFARSWARAADLPQPAPLAP